MARTRAVGSRAACVAIGLGLVLGLAGSAAAQAPAAFGKNRPLNGATGVVLKPTVSWQASAGATTYKVCATTEWDTPPVCPAWVDVGPVTSVTWPGDPLAYNTKYYWQVRAYNGTSFTPADGNGGWWSFTTLVQAPAAFGKAGPANGATGQARSLSLTWAASTRAEGYEYCYDTTNDSACAGSWTNVGNVTSAPVGGLAYGTTYYWQVRAVNAGGTTYADGQWWSFTTLIEPPGPFTKITPPNGGVVPTTGAHALAWGASARATYYEFCVDSTNDGACDGAWGQTLNGATGANVTDGVNGTTRYWQVRAGNSSGVTAADGGAWWHYRVEEPPRAFAKWTPGDGATAQPTSLTLTWAWADLATSYEYCYDTTNDSACAGSWTNVGNVTSAPISGLAYSTTYYWQVRAVNAYGSTEASMGTWYGFTTQIAPPGAFFKQSPTNGLTLTSPAFTYTWTESARAERYEFCNDYTNDGACDGAWMPLATTSLGASVTDASNGKTSYWHVRAVNASGTTYADSGLWWTFSRQVPPQPFSKSAPANGAADQATSLTLAWMASDLAASYDYCVDTTNDGVCGGAWTSAGAASSVAISGLARGTTYYWEVRAVNAYGTTSAEGKWWSFTTLPNPPAAFGKVAPENGATGRTRTPTVSWQASAGATSYLVCATTVPGSPPTCPSWVDVGTLTSVTWPGPPLDYGTTYYWQVRAVNSGGFTPADGNGGWWEFRTQVEPPGAFAKTAPADGATGQPTSVTLSWGTSARAASYEYCYDTTNDGSCWSWSSSGTATSASVSGLSGGTTYYWQVRAMNPGGSIEADGKWWSFTTRPGAFGKIAPANGATGRSLTPTASWEVSAGATSYEVCATTLPGDPPTCPAWVGVGSVTSVTWPGPALDPGTTYYWQVRAVTNGGFTAADDHAWWHFTTLPRPGIFGKTGPANGATGQSTSPTIAWEASADAASYEYCVDTTSDSVCTTNWTSVGAATTATLSGLADGTTYYWQVRAVNAGGTREADNLTWWSFATAPMPGAFPKIGPADGAVDQPVNPTLTWLPSLGAAEYEYCLATSAACPGAWTTVVSGTQVAVQALAPGTTYFWQVRAVNAVGSRESDGGWWRFTTEPAPEGFSKTAPAHGASGEPTTVTITWAPSDGAEGYEYCVAMSQACGGGWTAAGSATSAVVSGLTAGTIYYWQVRAVNTAGVTAADNGAWWGFTTLVPAGVFSKASPLNGSTGVPLRPTLTWQPKDGASGYEVCVNTSPTCPTTEWPSVGNVTSIMLPELDAATTYYWQVRAVVGGVRTAANGATWWRFMTLLDGAGSFDKTAPWNGATVGVSTVTLTWKPSVGATSYQYCMAENAVCSGDWTSVGLATSAVVSGLADNTTYFWQVRAVNSSGKVPANSGTWWRFSRGGTRATDIDAGSATACLLRSDGTPVCWGAYDMGKTPPAPGTFIQVSVGAAHACGVKVDGSVACWGNNGRGQAAPPSGTFVQVTANLWYTCGVKDDGTVVCWGSMPLASRPPSGAIAQLSAGVEFTCGIRTDGTLECWGDIGFDHETPPSGTFSQVDAGIDHACALRTDGTVACWGDERYGRTLPPEGTFLQVSAGANISCGIRSDGTVACWGDNAWGATTPPAGSFTRVSAGSSFACGIRDDGTVTCWGLNTAGRATPPDWSFTQVGTGLDFSCGLQPGGTVICWGDDRFGQSTPPAGTYVQVSTGLLHACAVRGDHTVACWGSYDATPPAGSFSQVSAGYGGSCGVRSDGAVVCWGTPYAPNGAVTPPPGTFTHVSAGDYYACGVRTDGTVACWGNNSDGQATPPAGTFTQVAAAVHHTCAIRTDGTVACWGHPSSNTTPPAGTFTEVNAGFDFTCGVRTDGALVCWGLTYRVAATPPAGTFMHVSAGYAHVCGVRIDGTIACWGDDGDGSAARVRLVPHGLPAATRGVAYTAPLAALGGTAAPYTFRVSEGTLPPGIALGGQTGLISGNPQEAGSWRFTVRAVDANFVTGDYTFTLQVNEPTAPPPRGDFTGDLKSDILWRHATGGDLWLWPMDGNARTAEAYVRTIADTTWEIRGVADFDGDGLADLLWRNSVNGQVYYWPMTGSTPLDEIYVGTVDPAYHIVGTGDFNGDSKADLLWRNTVNGEVWIWLMDGATPMSEVYVDRVDLGYVVKGVGDLDGDGQADIVWHHATLGEVWVWPMNGTTRLDQVWVGTVPDTEYQIEGVADFTGDGQADLVWWHATRGEVWIWTMNGTARVAETWVATVSDTDYRIVGTGDYNGDGKADLLWHHRTHGEVWVWLMNGTTRVSETWVATVPDTGYQIVK